jgi:anti-sigma factor RsiW
MGRLHRARWGHTIQSYADDELNAVRAATVVHHLARCPDCTGDLEIVRRLKSSLGRLGDRRPPEIAVARLRAEASRIGSR